MGTLVGAAAGNILPSSVISALGIAIYAMFVAIVVPQAKANRPTALCALTAVAVNCAFEYLPFLKSVPDGFSLIICAVAASVLFAALSPLPTAEEDSYEV